MNKPSRFGELPLGQHTDYPDQYSPGLLAPISRQLAREELAGGLPFVGEDIWNAYELSWLDARGKPQVASAEFRLVCDSPNIIESKSFKLYLNALNQSRFDSWDQLSNTLRKDLSASAGSEVTVKLFSSREWQLQHLSQLPGECIDALDVAVQEYQPNPGLLAIGEEQVEELSLHSHLFRSLCPVTAQPDWASVWVTYSGKLIKPESLLRYLVSFRKHQGFHEQCVEQLFLDIHSQCQPLKLTVGARFMRRGGLDINPVRSTEAVDFPNFRLLRQ